ncbi:MAG: PSD1 domain-containing protein [Planctomyces sp.]|nr:PSD1 domain-containing protein [Planctomyces sp.]
MTLRLSRAIGLGILAALSTSALAAEAPDAGRSQVEFNRDIRPLLSDRCFACHGPDKNTREADLRLDTEDGLRGEAGEGGAVTPGRPDDSELIRRIESDDPDERMPPPAFGKDLTPEERGLLRRWVEQGAEWQGHWAFQPIQRARPPEVSDADWSRHPIDRFVLAAIEQEGLRPSQLADPRTLVRRLSFDLTGLPPAPDVVERFASDPSEAAYERLVDELLASPHYGERMAMWWLDLVRYADSVGYHGDQYVSVSPYRDYVIRAFNRNMPFDEFTIEQLAGDLLPEPTLEQRVASGYNRLGMMSAEGGVQPKEYLSKYIAERVRNVSGAWLGVTLGCCECHDHKFDPFTAKDFYQFEAFFADIQEQGLYGGSDVTGRWGTMLPVPTAEQSRQQRELNEQMAAVQALLETPTEALAREQVAWESGLREWAVLRPEALESSGGATLTLLEDGSILASGDSPATDTYTLVVSAPSAAATALRLEALPDDSLPQKGPGRAGNGNFVLSELEVDWLPADGGEPQRIALENATATYEQTGAADANPYKKWAVAAAIDGDAQGPTWGWAVMEQVGRPNSAIFEIAAGTPLEPGQLRIVLKQNLDNPQHTLGRFRLSTTSAAKPVRAGDLPPADIEAILRVAGEARTEAQRNQLAAHYRSIAPSLLPQRQELARLEARKKALDAAITLTVVTERTEPRMIRVLKRGNWMDETGDVVEPAIPEWLGADPVPGDRRLTRLDLAQWIVSPRNPLTARATVNRLWKLLFGAGLSPKLDDLGAQGEWPSHPELLDALAAEFMDSGWDFKRLMKRIVMSRAYRQSSLAAAEQSEADPYNRWLSRQGRWRLEAEMVRDNALQVSGLMAPMVGGKSVHPYQPRGYWSYLNFPMREWQNGQGNELYRRGVYTHWQRQYLHPALLAFDAPGREECTADRPRSNTPLQALVLLNDPSYVEAARAFAQRALELGGDSDDARLAWLIREALAREPRPEETAVLLDLLNRHRQEYGGDSAAVDALLKIGDLPVPAALHRADLAAWISVTRAILNLHETITRN